MNALKRNYAIVVFFVTVLTFIVLTHITPKLAIRTHLFFTGHPVIAVTSDIKDAAVFDQQYGREYTVVDGREDVGTENDMSSLKVKKILFLYFANYGAA